MQYRRALIIFIANVVLHAIFVILRENTKPKGHSMLIEFSFSNFRSFPRVTTFSMAADSYRELESTHVIDIESPNKFRLLKSAAIYGANASGKSNFLKAIDAAQKIILTSASTNQRGDELSVDPFAFDLESSLSPSEFEFIFVNKGIRYQFGFSVTTERVVEEWCIAYPKGRPQNWYRRSYNPEKNDYDWDIKTSLKGEKDLWRKSTRSNALFLSTAIQLNSEQLIPVYDWFSRKLKVFTHTGTLGNSFTANICKETSNKIVKFLTRAGIEFDDIRVHERKIDLSDLPKGMPEGLRDAFEQELSKEIKFVRKFDDYEVEMDIEEESDGTKKMFSYAGPWLNTLEQGYVLMLDELHASLHPKLVSYLVGFFNSKKTNPNNAQLIFTTHETSILNSGELRRDQIWFADKNSDKKGSELYSLSEFSPRKDDNLEDKYLSGRFGGVPFIKHFEGLE